MHRWSFIAAFALLLGSVPLWAQHGGGGHGGGGGHASGGGFAGHSGGGFSGSHAGSSFATRPFPGGSSSRAPLSSRGYSSRGYGSRGYNRSYGRSGVGVRIRSYGYGNNCYGCRGAYGYPWGYAGGYDPYWWWDSGSSYDQSQDQQYQTGLANEMNQQSLDEQRMRQQGDQDLYAGSAPPPPREHREHEELNEAAPATVLVFRDEHKQEVHNYAIVGQTLWNFNPQHTQKIPLSDLDLPATTKENDERGVSFHVPSAPEGQ